MIRLQTRNLALCAALACSAAPEAAPEQTEVNAAREPLAAGSSALPAAPSHDAPTAKDAASRAPAPRVMQGAEQSFARIVELVSSDYMDATIDRDALYTGAIEGMLARLYQSKDEQSPVNALLSPRELRQIQSSSSGAIGGVGLVVEPEGNGFMIRGVLKGTPAQRAGLQAGDRVLGVDAARVKGMALVEFVDLIRGQPGTEVDLFVQRDTEEWHERLVRAKVTLRNVEGRAVAPGVGLLRFLSFIETTPADLDRELEALAAAGTQSLIIDLRYCPGGLLDVAIGAVERFLERGQRVVTLVDREGRRDERTAAANGRWREWPLAVLIGPDTASSAELFAEALAVHRKAVTIGQATLGKHSAETIHELDNGWGLKLSDSRLIGARGEASTGGLEPVLPVPVTHVAMPPALDSDASLDTAVRVATEWLRSRR
ncbi:MAG TPA: S41 family peptidase [Polyangiaceae bacterium]|nr:S41 family peptidase [Polyangiaceae bacterium]